jgi:hypothetical protein
MPHQVSPHPRPKCGDARDDLLATSEKRLARLGAPVHAVKGPASNAIPVIVRQLNSFGLHLAFVPQPPVIRRGASGSFYDKGLEGASHHAVIPNVNTIARLIHCR